MNGVHPDTDILLYFGGIKKAKDIQRADILVGDDNQPRIVKNINSGQGLLYKIIPETNDEFIINLSHNLTLYNESSGRTIDIILEDYLNKDNTWRKAYKLIHTPISYEKQDIKNEPYIIGLLTGKTIEFESDKGAQIAEADYKSQYKNNIASELLRRYLFKKLDKLSQFIHGNMSFKNLNITDLDYDEILQINETKYIPDNYIFNNKQVRTALLNGIIDITKVEDGKLKRSRSMERLQRIIDKNNKKVSFISDNDSNYSIGSVQIRGRSATRKSIKNVFRSRSADRFKATEQKGNSKKTTGQLLRKQNRDKYETVIRLNNDILCEQIKFLARSLGHEVVSVKTGKHEETLLKIYGVIGNGIKQFIPFNIEELGHYNYNSFSIDGNGRFIMGNCMISKNN